MRFLVLATLAALTACTTKEDAPIPDADLSLPMCTGELYDSCTTNTGCMSNMCKLYSGDGFQVCTQTCDAQTPCPMQNGQPAKCNNMGICKPNGANACHP